MSLILTASLIFCAVCMHQCDLNVGTTLFTQADSCNECWSSENIALLTSRMILEDLLPTTSILVIDNDQFVSDLIEYFRTILEIVRRETRGKSKHFTLLALTDVLGGYLHYAVLPIAKYSFYAGLISYESVASLLDFFEELKWFLRTSGQGWAKPLTPTLEHLAIQPASMQESPDFCQCDNLVFVEKHDCGATIPMPFFDSVTSPSAVAVPIRNYPLRNLEANSSSYLLSKFFVLAHNCLQKEDSKADSLRRFQTEFAAWIDKEVVPRLGDEKFYAAFGGVLRVRNTLEKCENSPGKQPEKTPAIEPQNLAPTNAQMSRSSMILMAVLITIIVWFILGTLFVCYKMRQTREKGGSRPDSGKTTTCSSLASSKCSQFLPECAKANKSQRAKQSRPKSDQNEIRIKTCVCNDYDGTSNTDGRLPSITEISERSIADRRRTQSAPDSTTPRTSTSKDTERSKVSKQVYEDSESDSEESSEPT